MKPGEQATPLQRRNMSRGSAARWLEEYPIPERAPAERPSRLPDGTLTKEGADCCMLAASRDDLGRPPIGYCGPTCERRQQRDARLAR